MLTLASSARDLVEIATAYTRDFSIRQVRRCNIGKERVAWERLVESEVCGKGIWNSIVFV